MRAQIETHGGFDSQRHPFAVLLSTARGADGAAIPAPHPKSRVFAWWRLLLQIPSDETLLQLDIGLMTAKRWDSWYRDSPRYQGYDVIRIACAPLVIATRLSRLP